MKVTARGHCRHLIVLAAAGALLGCVQMKMPGKSYRGPLPPLSDDQKALSARLHKHVNVIAGTIGERNIWKYDQLAAAARYIEEQLGQVGYEPRRQLYGARGKLVWNIEAQKLGTTRRDEIVVIGAHYDSVRGGPAANDNGSGVAAVLELARLLRDARLDCTIRFVFWVNEEPPFFRTDLMGSRVYAKRCRQGGDQLVAAISVETIGHYSDERHSQWYIPPFGLFYPDQANFIGFVGDFSSRNLLADSIESFRRSEQFPSEGVAASDWIPGIGLSDQRSFWQEGYSAFMVTDTAFFRSKDYHKPTDTPEKLDYDRMARVVNGLAHVLQDLAGSAQAGKQQCK